MSGQGGPEDWDRQAERRNGGSASRRLEDQLREHRADAFAHPALVDRLLTAGGVVRAGFETRLRSLENRVFAMTVGGAIGLVLLGALAGAFFTHLIK